MKAKKWLIASILALTAVFTAFGATACALVHEHAYSEWETVAEPTCTSFGLQKQTCACGDVVYATKESLGHTSVIDVAVEATCTTEGKTEGSHCAICQAVITAQTPTSKLPHAYSDLVTIVEPTCTSFGLQKQTCACGAVEYVTKDALGHTPVIDEAVVATCTTEGKTEGSHCSTCKTVLTAQNTIASVGHAFDEGTILEEALCNLDGTKRFSCTNEDCDYHYDESYALSEADPAEIFEAALGYTGKLYMLSNMGGPINQSAATIISEDGKIVTSNLKLDNAFSAWFVYDGEYYDVTEVLAYSETSHLAVLQTNATGLPYAPLCATEPAHGETVYIMGRPDGIPTMACGVVANGRTEEEGSTYIQHDADMTEDHLGGPLINRFGEVVGINVGFGGASLLNMASPVSAIYELDYSTPISMEEYGKQTYTTHEYLAQWIYSNAVSGADGTYAYILQAGTFYYAFGYDSNADVKYIKASWLKGDDYEVVVEIGLFEENGKYPYYASLEGSSGFNEVRGYIDMTTYDENTELTYETYYGRYWTEAELMELYRASLYDLVKWFDSFLKEYFVDITLETFGFTSVTFERDEQALDKLNDFVVANGTFDAEAQAYVVSGGTQNEDETMLFNVLYTPETDDVASKTDVNMQYYTAEGRLYTVTLTLNPTETGNRVAFSYAEFDGSEYVTQNEAWGYIEAHFFTDFYIPTCYEFIGMNEYEDALLFDYSSFLSYLLRLIDQSVMPLVSPELSIEDLGFWFYFG